MEVYKDIYQVGGPGYSSDSDCCIYLIKRNDKSFLIDTGTGEYFEEVKKNIESCGVQLKNIEKIFLTHCHYDHTGGAKDLRSITGADIIIHKDDAGYLKTADNMVTAAYFYNRRMEPLIPDLIIDSKEYDFDLEGNLFKMVHIPGHTKGSVAYLYKTGLKTILFGQDIHGPLFEEFKSDFNKYQKSLKKLLKIEIDILCEGHFGIYYGKEKVKKFISDFLV